MTQSMVLKDRGFTTGNAIASIGAQNPLFARGDEFYAAKVACYASFGILRERVCGDHPYYTGQGLAKVSDAAMDTPYGTDVAGGHGYGLGLSEVGIDQTTPEGAVVAMKVRIQVIFSMYLDWCVGHSCQNDTNSFLLAAMAGNGITGDDIKTMYKGIDPVNLPTDGVFDWVGWLNSSDKEDVRKNRWTVLQDYVNNWAWLETQGYELPENVHWDEVCRVLENNPYK